MSTKWGREETYHWPSSKPVWVITALMLAVLATIGTAVYNYEREWTFFQEKYLVAYVSSVSRPWLKTAPYPMVFHIEGRQERLEVDADLSDPAVLQGKAKLQWNRRGYLNTEMERWLREAIYEGHKPWVLFATAWKVGLGVLVMGFLLALPRDRARRRVLKYGRRAKGPELVTAAEFNRQNQSDGIRFLTKERRTVAEFVSRREGKKEFPQQGGAGLLDAEASTLRGTKESGELTSRSSFRKGTVQAAWDNAADGPTGGKLCPDCGKKVTSEPGSGMPRDWDIHHDPMWTEREFSEDVARQEVIDNYQEGTSLRCPSCNRADNQPPKD